MKTHAYPLSLSLIFIFLCLTAHAQFNWEHTGGPEGGGTVFLTSNDSYAFYADDNFLYRTSDGQTWEQLPTATNIWTFSGYGQSIFAEQRFIYPSGDFTSQLILSHDNGVSWIPCAFPDSLSVVHTLAMCSHGLYLPQGPAQRLYKSVDDGQTWETIIPPMTYGNNAQVWENRLYLYNSSAIWRTDTSGDNWTNITPPLSQSEYIGSFIAHEQNVIVTTSDHIWYTQNDGQSWNSHDVAWSNSNQDLVFDGSAVISLHGSSELSVSYNFGETWTNLGILDPTFFSFEVVNNTVLACSYQLGVYRWDSALDEFIPANSGLFSAPIYGLEYRDGLLWALSGSGVFDYDPNTDIWTKRLEPNAMSPYSEIKVGSNGLVVVGDGYMTLQVSQDGGQSWDTRQYDPFVLFGPFQFIYLYDDVIYIWAQIDVALRSEDFGGTWSEIPVPRWSYSGFAYFEGQLITGSEDTLYTSPDQGDSWQALSAVPAGEIWSVMVTEDRLFAISRIAPSQQALYSSVDGITWQYAQTGLPDAFRVNSFGEIGARCYKIEDKYFLVFDEIGTFASPDSAQTWIPVNFGNSNLGNPNPATMGEGVFYAAGHGGVVRATPSAYGSLMSGNVFWDLNGNGVQEGGEMDLPGVQVGLAAQSSINPYYFTTTNDLGAYVLGVIPSADDTLRPFMHSSYIESITPAYYTTESPGEQKNFGIQLTPDVHDLSIYSYLGFARPGFDLLYTINYRNEGTTIQDATVSVKIDPALEYLSANPSPDMILGDSLIWLVPQLPMLESGRIRVHLHVPAGTPLGTELQQTCTISSDQPDVTQDNNAHVATRIVVGSYDPNAKEVSPRQGLTRTEIEEGKELLYTIQFQNTGSYPAERVRITDQIDTALYLPSIRIVASSHDVTSFELNPAGLLVITLDHINLPDSTNNEADSHGFVTFAVKRKLPYSLFDLVVNKAAILFDFNDPVFTNLVAFTIRPEDPTSTTNAVREETRLEVFPNPASGTLNFRVAERPNNYTRLTVYDTAGHPCFETRDLHFAKGICTVKVKLPDGLYIVELSGKDSVARGKVVISTR